MEGVRSKDLVIFVRQFSVLISANVTLSDALKMLSDQAGDKYLKKIISEVASGVEGGVRLSDAFAKHPKVFSKFFINVIRSGETSGKLDEVLNYLADEMEKDYDLNGKIKGAMIYPVFIFVGLLVVGVVMMIFVVPKLIDMVAQTGGELPVTTRALVVISDFLIHFWLLIALILVGLAVAFVNFKKTKQGKMMIDSLVLKLPIFGNLLNKIYLVRFFRSLKTLIIGGSTVTNGLRIAVGVIDNNLYQELINKTIKEVEDGNSISSVFAQNKEIIPEIVPQMISVGEKTGRLDFVLEKIVNFYTREINTIVANLMSLMEPIVIVVMGVGVLLMMLAIVAPMYQMSQGM
jgi:type IV pilus assembly protein PilC